MKKFELFVVPQKERPKALGATVLLWLRELSEDEQLVVGLPEVLGKWENCTPLVLNPGMQQLFWGWLQENEKGVEGPVYNLPALTAGFLCVVVDKNFDPRTDGIPDDASEELKGVLTSLGNHMTAYEAQAA